MRFGRTVSSPGGGGGRAGGLLRLGGRGVRAGGGLGRQHGVARVAARRHHDDADQVQAGELHVRLDQHGLGELTGRRLDLDDPSDRYAGDERAAARGAEADDPVAVLDLGLAVEQFDPHRAGALAGGEADLVAALQPDAGGEAGVGGEEDGGGGRGDGGDPADEALAVDDGHVAGQAVVAAGVDGDRPGEALGGADRDDLGGLDGVSAGAGGVQQVVELLGAAGGGVGGGEPLAQLGVLLGDLVEPLLVGGGVPDGADGAGDRVDQSGGAALDRAEQPGRRPAGSAERRALASLDVHGDQCEGDRDQQDEQ
ncbi:hypothetical protein GCM10025734_31800 [Kitasatospora paranensis]